MKRGKRIGLGRAGRIAQILIALALAVSMTGSVAMQAMAAGSPHKMADGGIFDAEFYEQHHPDAVSAVGSNEEDLYNYYKSNKGGYVSNYPYATAAWELLQYDAAGAFVNDASGIEVFAFGTAKWQNVLKAAISGPLTGDSIADAFMKDGPQSKKILADMVEEWYTSYSHQEAINEAEKSKKNKGYQKSFFKLSEMVLKALQKDSALAQGAADAATVYTILGTLATTNVTFQKTMYDYSACIDYLEGLQDSLPEDTGLYQAAKELELQYETQVLPMWAGTVAKWLTSSNDVVTRIQKIKEYWSDKDEELSKLSGVNLDAWDAAGSITAIAMSDDKLIASADEVVKLAAKSAGVGPGYDAGKFLVEMILKFSHGQDAADALNKVTMATYLRREALDALSRAENVLAGDMNNEDKYHKFADAFNTAKALTQVQYDAMLDYYISAKPGAAEREKIAAASTELQKLNPKSYWKWMLDQCSATSKKVTDLTKLLGKSVTEVQQRVGNDVLQDSDTTMEFVNPSLIGAYIREPQTGYYEPNAYGRYGSIYFDEASGKVKEVTLSLVDAFDNSGYIPPYDVLGIKLGQSGESAANFMRLMGFQDKSPVMAGIKKYTKGNENVTLLLASRSGDGNDLRVEEVRYWIQ